MFKTPITPSSTLGLNTVSLLALPLTPLPGSPGLTEAKTFSSGLLQSAGSACLCYTACDPPLGIQGSVILKESLRGNDIEGRNFYIWNITKH